MKIRKATQKDSLEIKKLVGKVLPEIFKIKTPAKVLKDLDDIKENYVLFYVAEDNGKIVGCAGLKIYRGKPRLKRMYILKSYRRKGLGQKFLNKVLKYCKDKKYKKIILSTTPQMKKARQFYEANGFKRIKEDKKKNMIFFERKLK